MGPRNRVQFSFSCLFVYLFIHSFQKIFLETKIDKDWRWVDVAEEKERINIEAKMIRVSSPW